MLGWVMGKFIELSKLADNDSEWLVPRDLRRYDQRCKPWPNELWPYQLACADFHIQDPMLKVSMRRFIERHCQGDVVAEHGYTTQMSIWYFYFELSVDQRAFAAEYQPYTMEATDQ